MESISIIDAQDTLLKEWNIQASVRQLAGFEDINFFVQSTDGHQYLLKFSQETNTELIDAQVQLMNHIDIPVKSVQNGEISIRLLPWTKGQPWANHEPKTPELFRALGEKAAVHYEKISSFQHLALKRENFAWDLQNALWIKPHLDLLALDIRSIVNDRILKFEEIQSIFSSLPKSTIHNDLNDYNIIVDDNTISGFIDYGDICFSQSINELAILMAYGMMDQIAPIDAGIEILKGFTNKHPLTKDEIICLFTLINMRLAVSLVTSAQNIKEEPGNDYLQISRKPALRLIQDLNQRGEKYCSAKFVEAAGFSLFPENYLTQCLEGSETSIVVPMEPNDYYTLDLSVGSTELGHEKYFNDPFTHEKRINDMLAAEKREFAIGSYNEVRPLYSSDDFTEIGNEGQQWRTVHIGLDFFHKAGTEVYAFADGKVHALKFNSGDKNYGNTLIIQHEGFLTLYGHLSSETLTHLQEGQKVKAGELVAWFGEPHENGNWAPHLHFQIILDMLDYKGDFPGVCHINERSFWTQLSPDPRPFLGIKYQKSQTLKKDKILEKRSEVLGKSYSLSYQKPLHIVRAHGQYLYDNTGRKFLDCVNNVPHVGHQNIRVVERATKQMQVLNTNTRYLHQSIVDLADKLLETLPPHLKVCHFVNSGSEANELAIRMARVATGRNGVIAMEHGYHGNSNLCVDISSYKFSGKGGQGQKDFVQIVPMPDPVRSENHPEFKLDDTKEMPAAFIHESILSCGGQVVMPENFFSQLYNRFQAKGIIMIADEVQTGLGRIGSHMWAFQAEDIDPDIVTIGKPFGNGHPLAAVVSTLEIAEAFHNGMEYFNTFGGNAVSCSIGLEVLRVIEDEQLQLHALNLGQYITERLRAIQNKYPIIADVRGRGLFLGWEFAHPETMEPLADRASFFVNEMKRYGILLSTDGPMHNVIKFKPPMVFTKDNANYMLETMEEVLAYL